jgi:hypothetical protein
MLIRMSPRRDDPALTPPPSTPAMVRRAALAMALGALGCGAATAPADAAVDAVDDRPDVSATPDRIAPMPPPRDASVTPMPFPPDGGFIPPMPPPQDGGFIPPMPPPQDSGFIPPMPPPMPPPEDSGFIPPMPPPMPPPEDSGFIPPMPPPPPDGSF